MFVGHYAVALAAKKFAPKQSLGWLFAAVQFLDILWAPAILLGIEHARVVRGFLPASSLVLYDIPWTHSLLMAVAWSWLVFRFSKSPILGACVFSHWVLDWVTHIPDLPLYKGGPRVGLGLWRNAHATALVEGVLLLVGLMVYLQATRPRNRTGDYAMPAFVIVLIALNLVNLYGPPAPNIHIVAVEAETAYIVLALAAAWLDRLRQPAPSEPSIKLGLNEA